MKVNNWDTTGLTESWVCVSGVTPLKVVPVIIGISTRCKISTHFLSFLVHNNTIEAKNKQNNVTYTCQLSEARLESFL